MEMVQAEGRIDLLERTSRPRPHPWKAGVVPGWRLQGSASY
jgi:hypothetical protein